MCWAADDEDNEAEAADAEFAAAAVTAADTAGAKNLDSLAVDAGFVDDVVVAAAVAGEAAEETPPRWPPTTAPSGCDPLAVCETPPAGSKRSR